MKNRTRKSRMTKRRKSRCNYRGGANAGGANAGGANAGGANAGGANNANAGANGIPPPPMLRRANAQIAPQFTEQQIYNLLLQRAKEMTDQEIRGLDPEIRNILKNMIHDSHDDEQINKWNNATA